MKSHCIRRDEKVMKEYNQNFTVMRVFDALLQGKIERGELKL